MLEAARECAHRDALRHSRYEIGSRIDRDMPMKVHFEQFLQRIRVSHEMTATPAYSRVLDRMRPRKEKKPCR
jgi:hypothetical protein